MASQSSPGDRRRIGRRLLLSVALLAIVLAAGQFAWWQATATDRLIRQASQAADNGEWLKARAMSERAVERNPDSRPARILAAQAASAAGDFQRCLKHLEAVPDDGSEDAVAARCLAGDLLLLHFKQLSAAEEQYRRALEQEPGRLDAHDHLAFGLGLANRVWEQVPHRLHVIRSGQFEPIHLQSLALGRRAMENDDLVQEYHKAAPDDPAPRLMMARLAMEAQDFARAETLLREALRLAPEMLETHVKLGRVLLQSDRVDAMPAWQAALPENAAEHPGIWAIRGEWARRDGDEEGAARCYWEAVRISPEHDLAVYQLGRTLIALGRAEEAAPFLDRAQRLQQYVNTVTSAMELGDPRVMVKAGDAAQQLGLTYEAFGWKRLALRRAPGDREVERQCAALAASLRTAKIARSPVRENPTRTVDLADLPLPRVVTSPAAGRPARTAADSFRFEDRAAEAGIAFDYFNSGEPDETIAWMQEFTGGGVAVLDFDNDALPDLYLTQGCDWEQGEPLPDPSRYVDRLFRNLPAAGFEDVTREARLTAADFGQGATVGDFNSDGFPDIFVANIGENRLFQNNGDGTFSEVTAEAGVEGAAWSTSSVLADLNQDGLPDLYVVNYLTGENVFTQVCRGPGGRRGACFPQAFPAAQDRVYWNRGDGTFDDATATAGIVHPNGKGLGILAFDLEASERLEQAAAAQPQQPGEAPAAPRGRLALFVANDTEANCLFVNRSDAAGPIQLENEAVLRGVAMNDQGKLEACMGVAVGDADRDGQLDLLVTNFFDESNTLYRHLEGGLFEDATARSSLRSPSMKQLGFGVQFVDGNLNGDLDLVWVNGHIADFRDEGVPYKMPPQAFSNLGDGRFRELAPEAAGPYFAEKRLARAVARLDWNKDGADDLAVGHLDRPLALLTNATESRGNFLAVRLRGVASERDAIGAVVRATIDGRSQVRQLTAGDGYHASNERRLVFGAGAAKTIQRLEILWPSGKLQTFGQLPLNREVLIVEGSESVEELAP